MRTGQMLVEVLLAIAVAALVLVGMAQLSTRSLTTSNFSRSKSQADVYAQEAVEMIRTERTTKGWSDFFTSYSCDTLDGTLTGGFTRNATCTKVSGIPEKVTVTVTVSWAEAGKTFNSTQTTELNQY
ncbi:MAG: Tfp pilus assembly protein pilV [Candidatus Amesbacteria bacterium GW2011_GWA1_47_20]|uniref:Tfp pilus assembly protein pilV n=2 Tax=Candidatus Amesiibacteriota TaxID=1752730 RepID=A0A0G1SG02_9BACT|nr:MAG: Tfp pilus assembly protein pilV [Candidatus Amesbacteria bacterium GW2011_GWA1_47_20]KKU83339.1 MAG: Tfp pilus assembly protein pilV [Candidatus Amesbacteria bacterium GW2011_GWC2_47_8]